MTTQELKNRLDAANVPYTEILYDGSGFYSIYFDGRTVENANKFYQSAKEVRDLDQCVGESGFDSFRGHWQRFKFWN